LLLTVPALHFELRASSFELRADPSTTHTHAHIRPRYTPTTRPPDHLTTCSPDHHTHRLCGWSRREQVWNLHLHLRAT
jgi:hypothetical protein